MQRVRGHQRARTGIAAAATALRGHLASRVLTGCRVAITSRSSAASCSTAWVRSHSVCAPRTARTQRRTVPGGRSRSAAICRCPTRPGAGQQRGADHGTWSRLGQHRAGQQHVGGAATAAAGPPRPQRQRRVAANALLSFFPFVLLLMTLIRRVFHSPVMYDVVVQLLRDFLPAGQDFVIRNLNALVGARNQAQVVSLAILLVTQPEFSFRWKWH